MSKLWTAYRREKITMEYLWRKFLCMALLVGMLAVPCLAEKGVLAVQVNDVQNHPIAGVLIKAEGASEPGKSDTNGLARIKLDNNIKVNAWIHVQILKSPPGRDLVLISPWDGTAQVPPFGDQTSNHVLVILANRGDRMLLENGTALNAFAARINRANSPKPKTQDTEERRREALATVAATFGLSADEVDKAIRAWGERTDDPYERGLVALYEENYSLASEELAHSLEKREGELAKAQEATANAALFLGQSKYEEGKYNESVDAYIKVLKLRPKDSTALNNLGVSLQAKKDYAGAEPLYRRALAIDEKELGPDHPDVGTVSYNLAGLLNITGSYAEAEPLYRRALAIEEKALGPDHPDLAPALNNLALMLKTKHDYAGAEPLYRRALAINEKALGPDHPTVGVNLINLAVLLKDKRDFGAAESLCRRALAIAEKTLGPDHPDMRTYLDNLAWLLQIKEDYEGAEPLYRRSLAIAETSLGPDHPHLGTILNNLALVLKTKRDYAGAEPLYRRALAIAEKTLGPDHPYLVTYLNNLALLLKNKGDYAEAESLYRRALAIAEKSMGLDHPITLRIKTDLKTLFNEREKAIQPK